MSTISYHSPSSGYVTQLHWTKNVETWKKVLIFSIYNYFSLYLVFLLFLFNFLEKHECVWTGYYVVCINKTHCSEIVYPLQIPEREKDKEKAERKKTMEGKEEDVRLGANKFSERQPIGTSAQTDKDYKEPPPAPLFEPGELQSWSFWRAGIAEFVATFLFLYITVLTVMGVSRSPNKCATVGIQGIAWAFGGTIFALVYSTAGISGQLLSFLSLCSLIYYWLLIFLMLLLVCFL